jgi:type I restriction enzyme S subunit
LTLQVPIGEISTEPTTWNPRESGSTRPFPYIDIASIQADEKRIGDVTSISPSEAPSRARQLVRAGDVLVSTVRPNLNAVAIVPPALDGATASTGFAVLRPNPARVDSKFLYYWVRTPPFVRAMVARSTGASYPAITENAVRESRIPLPPLAEQGRIAAMLDKADAVRRKRRESLRLLNDLLHSAYMTIVGPAATQYDTWPQVEIADLGAGPDSMRTGPFGSALRHSEFVDSGIAVLGIDNAVQNRFAWGERRLITREKYEKFERYRVHPGDVIVTIMGTTGRSAVVPDDIPIAISTKHLAVITVDCARVHPMFVSHAIHSDPTVLAQVRAENRGAIMSGLNLGIIKRLRLRVPPVTAQLRFAALVVGVSGTQMRATGAVGDANRLFDSLVQRAFGHEASGVDEP